MGKGIDSYVFEGAHGKYSARTVQEIVGKAALGAGIKKRVHPHTLRHSFATHMVEDGYGIEVVQSLLGHSRPETTMAYLHVDPPRLLNAKSPLDTFNSVSAMRREGCRPICIRGDS